MVHRVWIYPIVIVSLHNTIWILTKHVLSYLVQIVWTITWLLNEAWGNLLVHVIILGGLWKWTLISSSLLLGAIFSVGLFLTFKRSKSLIINIPERLLHHLYLLLKFVDGLFWIQILLYCTLAIILLIEKALSCWHSETLLWVPQIDALSGSTLFISYFISHGSKLSYLGVLGGINLLMVVDSAIIVDGEIYYFVYYHDVRLVNTADWAIHSWIGMIILALL